MRGYWSSHPLTFLNQSLRGEHNVGGIVSLAVEEAPGEVPHLPKIGSLRHAFPNAMNRTGPSISRTYIKVKNECFAKVAESTHLGLTIKGRECPRRDEISNNGRMATNSWVSLYHECTRKVYKFVIRLVALCGFECWPATTKMSGLPTCARGGNL